MYEVFNDLVPVLQHRLAAKVALAGGREENFVWQLFIKGIPAIEELLQPHFGNALSINAVFCHSTPRAHFKQASGNPTSCEIGDLLVVVHHLFGPGSRLGRSLLLQAKMTDTESVSRDQTELYHHWPPFTFTYQGQSVCRFVRCGEHQGAQFAFIERDTGCVTVTQRPAKPLPPFSWEATLATHLLTMLTLPQSGGRELWPNKAATKDQSGWSPVVWDLLQRTFSRETYSNKGPRVLHPERVAFLLAETVPQLFARSRWKNDAEQLWRMAAERRVDAGDIPPPDDAVDDRVDGPIPTIVVEVDWQKFGRRASGAGR